VSTSKVVLDASWLESEKGNTMLVNDDHAIAAWIKVGIDTYMEITDTPGNSPRLYVTFIQETPAKLKRAIRKQCEGWWCVRWNIDAKAPIDEEGCIK
jgi:hypothetical protein